MFLMGGYQSVCTCMCAGAGCGRVEGCEHQQLDLGGQMGWIMRDREGETADISNPHPAKASVGDEVGTSINDATAAS